MTAAQLPLALQQPGRGATLESVEEVAAARPTPILDVFVAGTPKPKGSLRHVGKGRMVEQLAGSPTWRGTVREVAHGAARCCADPTCGHLKAGYPNTGGVEVRAVLFFAKPKSAPKTRDILPVTRSTGDIDKHARNLLDALVDAGVLRDDSQVIDLTVSKRYCRDGETPGARIVITSADEAATTRSTK